MTGTRFNSIFNDFYHFIDQKSVKNIKMITLHSTFDPLTMTCWLDNDNKSKWMKTMTVTITSCCYRHKNWDKPTKLQLDDDRIGVGTKNCSSLQTGDHKSRREYEETGNKIAIWNMLLTLLLPRLSQFVDILCWKEVFWLHWMSLWILLQKKWTD